MQLRVLEKSPDGVQLSWISDPKFMSPPPRCMLAVGGGKRRHGFRGGVSGAHRPDPQELPEAVQPPHRRGGVGPGRHHQHADPLRQDPVPQPQHERE